MPHLQDVVGGFMEVLIQDSEYMCAHLKIKAISVGKTIFKEDLECIEPFMFRNARRRS